MKEISRSKMTETPKQNYGNAYMSLLFCSGGTAQCTNAGRNGET
jgi:hypothetical protein